MIFIKNWFNNIKRFAIEIWLDKTIFIFIILTFALNTYLAYSSYQKSLITQPSITIALILSLINILLSMVSFLRNRILSILFLWASIYFAIYSFIYLNKTLL